MKYKVGDRVKIKSLDWYNENKDEDGNIELSTHIFISEMSQFCGKVVTIKDVFEDDYENVDYNIYYMKEIDYDWIDEMIEGLVEEETSQNAKLVSERFSEYVNPSEFKYAQDTITKMLLQGANIPNEYVLKDENGNVINATKIVLEKKKEYPKTYEECCEIVKVGKEHTLEGTTIRINYKIALLESFQKLLICRDAYWKIAGEEMGLGKPWEPDWTNQELPKYCIASVEGQVKTAERYIINTICSFPTEEMRDAFKDNFDPDIEFCKELL